MRHLNKVTIAALISITFAGTQPKYRFFEDIDLETMRGVGELKDSPVAPCFRFSYIDDSLVSVEYTSQKQKKNKTKGIPLIWNIGSLSEYKILTTPVLDFPDCNYIDSILLDKKLTVAKISCAGKDAYADFYIYLFEPLSRDSIKVIQFANAGNASLLRIRTSFKSCNLNEQKRRDDLVILNEDYIVIQSLEGGQYREKRRYDTRNKKRIRVLYQHYFFY
jgi:hypothetical protein